MKKIFYILLSFIFILGIFWYSTFAEEKKKVSPYSFKSWFKLYNERVKNICDTYKEKKQVVKLEENYLDLEGQFDLDEIKETHRENMNSIYKCWILSVQEKALTLIKEELIKKNPNLIESLVEKIDAKIEVIKFSFVALDCIYTEETSSILKLHVLKQATYQTCKYVSYLEYVKDYNNYVENIWTFKWHKEVIAGLINLQERNKVELNDEIAHTYKVFPLAFHAYTEYENNITIHYLLELIKEDYIVLRDNLHKVLNPINQVIYKISNAMRK